MADTIWVIEQGEYSEYEVVGVFSSEQNAQAVADAINATRHGSRSSEATVAEWPLDPAIDALRQGFVPFVVMMLEDGTVELAQRHTVSSAPSLVEDTFMCRRSKWRATEPDVLRAVVFAKDEAHAIKITNEHRTRLIATGEWAND